LTAAKENVQKLAVKGMKLGGKGDAWVKQTAWLGATEFAGQLTIVDELVGTTRDTRPDPLLGNPPQNQPDNRSGSAITLA
jgi:hypothetical protein